VTIGACSRGGLTRGDHRASDPARGCQEKEGPCGSVDEESGAGPLTFGSSSTTRAFIVDTLAATGEAMAEPEKAETRLLQISRDHGPESRGRRTQFLSRMGPLADRIHTPLQRLYAPPYHRTYHPMERCWGIVEWQWKGTKLTDAETMLGWAKQMTWPGIHPIVALSRQVSHKGLSLGKAAMQALEARLKRDPNLPKYAIVINPAPTS
jgi:hypothetical protein